MSRTLRAIEALPPGEVLVYFTGHLARACESGDERFQRNAREARNGAQRAYDGGLCFLTQRRRPDGMTDYLATRRVRKPGREFMRAFEELVA